MDPQKQLQDLSDEFQQLQTGELQYAVHLFYSRYLIVFPAPRARRSDRCPPEARVAAAGEPGRTDRVQPAGR